MKLILLRFQTKIKQENRTSYRKLPITGTWYGIYEKNSCSFRLVVRFKKKKYIFKTDKISVCFPLIQSDELYRVKTNPTTFCN